MIAVEVLPDMSSSERIILVAAVAVLTASVGIFLFMESVNRSSGAESQTAPEITLEEAIDIALENTKVAAENATVSKRELIYKSDIPEYRIQFSTIEDKDNLLFVCSINGITGDVLNVRKTIASRASSEKEKASDSEMYDDPDQSIGVERVKNIVLSDAGLSADEVSFKSVRLINRNNIMIYIAEFGNEEVDYKFFVDAVTGSVIERRVEYDED